MNKFPRSPSSETLRGSPATDASSQSSTSQRRLSSPHSIRGPESPLPPISTIPSAIGNWETSPQSPTPDKQKPFKSKSKHNLAIFGAKLTSTAASVGVHTSKLKQREKDYPKEANRESVFIDLPDPLPHPYDATIGSPTNPSPVSGAGRSNSQSSGSGGGGGMLKSKMFKQSKSDLKSLRIKTDLGIQAARSSLNDRSPMVRGGSLKELDRIAAIGQTSSPAPSGESSHSGHSNNHHHYHHLHHPHISFRKRDSPAAVLSSSASNSTLASEGTVYSFNQSNNTGLPSGLTSFKSPEECVFAITLSWTLLTTRIQPSFNRDEPLKLPVEDLNILVLLHLRAHYWMNGTGLEVLNRVDELLQTGLKSSTVLPQSPTLESMAESWHYFHKNTLISLVAAFLPLQLEFDGQGVILETPQAASEYWYPVGTRQSSGMRTGRRFQKLNVKRKVLLMYRDIGILPILPQLSRHLDEFANSSTGVSGEIASQILQCVTTLANLQTQDEAQKSIETALASVRGGILKRHRLSKEHKVSARRGQP